MMQAVGVYCERKDDSDLPEWEKKPLLVKGLCQSEAGYVDQRNLKLCFPGSGPFCSQLDPSITKFIFFDSLEELKGSIYENMIRDAFAKQKNEAFLTIPMANKAKLIS